MSAWNGGIKASQWNWNTVLCDSLWPHQTMYKATRWIPWQNWICYTMDGFAPVYLIYFWQVNNKVGSLSWNYKFKSEILTQILICIIFILNSVSFNYHCPEKAQQLQVTTVKDGNFTITYTLVFHNWTLTIIAKDDKVLLFMKFPPLATVAIIIVTFTIFRNTCVCKVVLHLRS